MTETTPGLGGLLEAMSDAHTRRLEMRDDATTALLRQDWAMVEARALGDLKALQERIDVARAAGTPISPSWLYRQERYRDLLATVQEQTAAYGGRAAREVSQGQAWAQGQAQADAAAMTGQVAAGAAVSLVAVNPANLTAAAGFLADGSPLADLFAGMGPEAVGRARAVLTQAAAFGWGADKTARQFRDVLALTRTRAETIARTELHRVYRTTTRDTYAANADVVTGWTWRAHIDRKTCPGCMAMDGTVHPVDEVLAGHPRCRCAMVPLTPTWADLGLDGVPETGITPEGRGERRLAAMSAAEQDGILGPTKAALYRQGQITLEDCVTRAYDPRWGVMHREATVAEARAHAAARGVIQRVSRSTPRTGTQPARRKTAAEVRAETAAIRERTAEARAELARVEAQREALREANLEAQARLQGAPSAVQANATRTLTPEQYEVLRPSRSGWSAERRQDILRTMRSTPEGTVLADTLERFQDGGSIARLRGVIDKRLRGEAVPAMSAQRADALLGAIRDAPTDMAPATLYRGMTVKGSLDNVLAKYQGGGDLDLSLTSFSSDRAVAKRFQDMTGGGTKGTTRVMVEWVGDGKRALPIQDLPADRRLAREKEWVTAGRYRVVEAKKAPGGGILLRIEQTGTM